MKKSHSYQNVKGWLDIPKLLGEPPLIAVVTTARGKSKTFGWLKYTLGLALSTIDIECGDKEQKADAQFLLLRRVVVDLDTYKTDLYTGELIEEALEEFDLDFSDYRCDFEVVGRGIAKVYFLLKDLESDEIHRRCHVGYISAIPSHSRFRGSGLINVTNIMLDEFNPLSKVDYSPTVVMHFLDICYSVIRKRSNVKIYLAGNPSSVVSEFFQFFGHTKVEEERVEIEFDGIPICFYNLNIDGGVEELSPFERMIKKTSYGDYAVSNEFTDIDNQSIKKRKKEDKFIFSIKLGDSGFVTIYNCVREDKKRYYLVSRHNPTEANKYTDYAPRKGEMRNLDAYRQCYKMLQTQNLYYETPDLIILFERYISKFPANRDTGANKTY